MQICDLFAMQAHWGWCHVLLTRLQKLDPKSCWFGTPIAKLLDRMGEHTDRVSQQFDQCYGTETFHRTFVPVSGDPENTDVWGYGPVNQDFFREILCSIPVDLAPYTFVDIGSGKGAAVMMASEFPFRRSVGIELSAELIAIARRNVEKFNAVTRQQLQPEWFHCDFFNWSILQEPQLFFFNNPFPPALSLSAIQKLEQDWSANPQPVLLVFRKAPGIVGDHLHQSTFWQPLRLAPYWRVYSSPKQA